MTGCVPVTLMVLALLYLCRPLALLIILAARARWLFVPRLTHRLENNGKSRIRIKHGFTEQKDRR